MIDHRFMKDDGNGELGVSIRCTIGCMKGEDVLYRYTAIV